MVGLKSVKDNIGNFLRLLQVGLYGKEYETEHTVDFNDTKPGYDKHQRYTGKSQVKKEQGQVKFKGKKGKIFDSEISGIADSLIEGRPDALKVNVEIIGEGSGPHGNGTNVINSVTVQYRTVEEADLARECIAYFKQQSAPSEQSLKDNYNQFFNVCINKWGLTSEKTHEKLTNAINKLISAVYTAINIDDPIIATSNDKPKAFAANFELLKEELNKERLKLQEKVIAVKDIQGKTSNSAFKHIQEKRSTFVHGKNTPDQKKKAREDFVKAIMVASSNKLEPKDILKPIHDLLEVGVDTIAEDQLKIFEKFAATLQTLPKKEWKHTGVDLVYFTTAFAFGVGLICSASNIKPFKDMLQNMTKAEMVSPAGKFMKSIIDFATKQVGFNKSVIATTAIALVGIGVAIIRGMKTEELRENKDKFWGNFVRDYYNAQDEVLKDNAHKGK